MHNEDMLAFLSKKQSLAILVETTALALLLLMNVEESSQLIIIEFHEFSCLISYL